ncbi:unnamed protein product [Rotaria sp. Silwood1]|nr:unnamed protein product [Rotaria sp. Silwood1]CAF1640639.1 unnamed protein product [Rotaria sp. Silwood1]
MTSSTILNLKTPSQDAQGCWYETLSPAQVLTGQQQQQQPVKPQNDEQMKQKKKCRGNRKAQRLRRRLRQQGLDPDTITELVNQKINPQRRQQHDEAIQYNRIPQSAQHKNNYQDTVKMLINSLEGAKEIVKRLNSKDKINYIRQYAYLIHRLFYVQLQESQ